MGRNYATWFFAVLLLVMWGVTHIELVKGPRFRFIKPGPAGGDEVHYMLAIDSLLFYGKLELQQAYGHAYYLGLNGRLPDHHTIVVNRTTGKAVSWFAAWRLHDKIKPDVYSDWYEVSLHPMVFPMLVAGALYQFEPTVEHSQADAAFVMVLIGWTTALVLYLITGSLWPAVVLVLASPWLAYSKGLWSETPVGLALVLALWAMKSSRPGWTGLACGAAVAFKPPFAVAGIGFLAEYLMTRQWRHACTLALVFGLCGLGLLYWNWWLARTWVIPPSGIIYPTAGRSLYETFLGTKYGLLGFAPWVMFAIPAMMYGQVDGNRSRLRAGVLGNDAGAVYDGHRAMLISIVLYVAVLAYFRPIPAACYGPRYWIAFLPWLAIGLVETAQRWPKTRYAVIAMACLGAAIAIPSALRYREMFQHPVTAAWMGLW